MGVEAASSLAAELDESNRRAVEMEQAHGVSFEADVALPTYERDRQLLPEERSHRLASMLPKYAESTSTDCRQPTGQRRFLAGNQDVKVHVAIGRRPDRSLVFGPSAVSPTQKYRNQFEFHLPRHRLTENAIRK